MMKTKKKLLALIRNEWSTDTYAEDLKNRKIYFVCDEECTLLTSEDGLSTDMRPIFELFSSQEEADTRIMLHLKYANDTSRAESVIVRSTDTDVFLLLVHFLPQFTNLRDVKFDTGVGDRRRWIDVNFLYQSMSADFISSLLGFHAFTGCESTSSFVRKGKLKPLRFLINSKLIQSVFQDIGNQPHISEKTRKDLEKFTCKIYGGTVISNIDTLRYLKAKERFRFHAKGTRLVFEKDNADLSLLPPCRTSLQLHIDRANYQTYVWKQSLNAYPELPSLEENGWKLENGQLAMRWGYNMFPSELEEVLIQSAEDTDSDNESDISSTNISDFLEDYSDSEEDSDED